MPTEFFYTQNGQAAPAPVPGDQLRQLAASGQLQPTDMVWKEGMPTWLPAATVKGLFPTKPPTAEMPAASPGNLGEKAVPGKGPRSTTKLTKPSAPAAPAAPRPGLSPVAVLLLTLITGGIFGLVYALRQPFPAPTRAADGSARPSGVPRHPVRVGVLSYLTLGIYLAWWAHMVIQECAYYLERSDLNARGELALMFAFPPYAIYVVAFKLPALVQQVRTKAGLPEAAGLSRASLFASLTGLPFLPLLGMAIQEAMNEVWGAGRYSARGEE